MTELRSKRCAYGSQRKLFNSVEGLLLGEHEDSSTEIVRPAIGLKLECCTNWTQAQQDLIVELQPIQTVAGMQTPQTSRRL